MRRASWTRLAVVKAAGLSRANGADRHCQMGTECHAVDAAANCVDQGDVSHLFRCLILTRLHWRSRIVCLPLGDLLQKAWRLSLGPCLRRRVWWLKPRRGVARVSPFAGYDGGPIPPARRSRLTSTLMGSSRAQLVRVAEALRPPERRHFASTNCLQMPYSSAFQSRWISNGDAGPVGSVGTSIGRFQFVAI